MEAERLLGGGEDYLPRAGRRRVALRLTLILGLLGCAAAAVALVGARGGKRAATEDALPISEALVNPDPVIDDIDPSCETAQCLENGEKDEDCCAMPGMGSCADGFWPIQGFKCFANGAVRTCCRKPPRFPEEGECAKPIEGQCTEDGKPDPDCCSLRGSGGCAPGYKYLHGDTCFKANGAVSSCCVKQEGWEDKAKPWECHRYDAAAGENDEWCATVGTRDGFEYIHTEGGGTCGKCWCCKRPVDAPTEAPKKPWAPLPAIAEHTTSAEVSTSTEEPSTATEKAAEPSSTAAPTTSKEVSASTEAPPTATEKAVEPSAKDDTNGVWKCHTYEGWQGNDWCKNVGIQDGLEYNFTYGGGQCDDCWCCKRPAKTPPYVEQPAAKKTNTTWQCHKYEDGQGNDWCRSVGINDGKAYKFTEGGGLCGDCWCCKRDVQPGDCGPTGESCAVSQCCNQQGQQCYKKDAYWASCQAKCVQDGDWSCDRLGVRSSQKVQCTWPGQDCALTRQCCNANTQCIRQNNQSAWCTGGQIPPDWDGTVLGGARQPWPIGPAAPGKPVMGTTLFCFMAVLPGSAEEGLVQAARDRQGGIFGCDESKVYQSGHSQFVHKGSWNSWVNTGVFVKVWANVIHDGLWKKHDWSVKVDPDTVFLPSRLRWHLQQLRPPAGLPIYVENSAMSTLRFLGAIEIVSKRGLELYGENYKDCHSSIGDQTGEDGFMAGCFQSIGVGVMIDTAILNTPADTSPCTDPSRVAFHPRKTPFAWGSCWDNAAR